jgi:hypothetical protein
MKSYLFPARKKRQYLLLLHTHTHVQKTFNKLHPSFFYYFNAVNKQQQKGVVVVAVVVVVVACLSIYHSGGAFLSPLENHNLPSLT